MKGEDRDKVDNLILLCPNHHREIDKNPKVWTVDRLRKIKEDHECWVKDSLDNRITPYKYFNETSHGIEIDFDQAKSNRDESPFFSFSLRNMWSSDVVVHSIDAEVLALGVLPSKRQQEFELAALAVIPRTPVTFDFSSAAEADLVPATDEVSTLERLFRRMWHFDPFEVAILLRPGEAEVFKAKVFTGSFAMGTFRLVATYWNRPTFHYKAFSSSVGFFSVPDRGGWWFIGSKSSASHSEASVMSFESLVIEASKHSRLERPIWSDDVFDRAQLERPIWSDDVFDRAQLFQRTLGRLDHTKSRTLIEDWLEADDLRLSTAALEAIEAAPNSNWKSALAERALSSRQEAVRTNAISIIGDLQYTDAFETLACKALADPSRRVRQRALRRLQYTSNAKVVRRLQELKNDPDDEIRKLARERLK